jgi:hypothetical protein
MHELSESASIQAFRKSMSRHSTLRTFMINSASDFVEAFTFRDQSSSIPQNLSTSSSSDRYPSFPKLSFSRQARFHGIAHASLPEKDLDIATLWADFILPHWPESYKNSRRCARVGCGAKPARWCPRCKMVLCFASRSTPTSNNCWLQLHSHLFTRTLDSYFSSNIEIRKRNRGSDSFDSTNSDLSFYSDVSDSEQTDDN